MPDKHKLRLGTNSQTHIAVIAAAFLLGLAAGPKPAFGLGLALPDQDAFATARGNAFVATADDPAAVFYNPAGISQLQGFNISAGAYGIVDSDRYTGPKGSVNGKTQWSAVPQVFSTFTLSNYNLAFGLGVYSPYGLRMEWPNTAPFLAAGETGQVTYERLAGVVSWQIVPCLSVAAGPTLNYSEVDLKEYVTIPMGPSFVNHFRGGATDAGYTGGVLFHPWEQHYFGVTYRSATEMNYNGHATLPLAGVNVASSADFHYPQTLAFGYSYRPTENWNIEADANWTDWSSLNSVPLVPSPPLPASDTLNFNWTQSWILGVGATRYLPHNWRLSGGYMYSENSVPDGNFNPLVPDSDRHVFSLGVGKRCGRFSWDAAYQFAWGPPRSVSGDATPAYPPGAADGKYEFFSHALTINIGYHF